MLLDAPAWAVLGGSVIGMAIILVRKFPTLASIDTTHPQAALEARKKSIIEQRLVRKVEHWRRQAGRRVSSSRAASTAA